MRLQITRFTPFLFIVTLMFGSEALGQDMPPPAETVRYASVDASTLRVFSLGTVGVEVMQSQGVRIDVAAPQSGHGTGFAIDSSLIVTAQHVIEGARHVVIRLPGEGGFLPARVLYRSKEEDIAILHVDSTLTPIRMAPAEEALRIRQTVFAVGYPLDASRTQAQSAKGIIAGHLEDNSLQLDISLNPGNSGGPLVDEKDQVVGMVIARGDVEQGVQGIGIAVPNTKLREAIVKARQELSSGNVAPLTVRDTMSAEVVDELIQQGTLNSVQDEDDLKNSLIGLGIEQEIEQLASRLNDADLLVFVAGNLWNAGLVIHYGRVRKMGDKVLTEEEARTLAANLRAAAIRLATRAGEIDATVSTRSTFVRTALSQSLTQSTVPPSSHASSSITPYQPTTFTRWTIAAYPHLRLNESADGGWGAGIEVKQQLKGRGQVFGSWGMSVGQVWLDTSDTSELAHRFVAFEAGLGISMPMGASSTLEFYGGIAPSYYSVSVESESGETSSESGTLLNHLRATISFATQRYYLSTGVRRISSTLWLEPIGLGINF